MKNSTKSRDRRRALESGFTPEEANCWVSLSRLCDQIITLSNLMPVDDRPGMVEKVVEMQTSLMARPTFRKYLEARAAEVY